jgi:hypothetical protein
MNIPKLLLLTATAALCAPATASAAFIHTVAPGESLSSVAATDGLSVYQLAAANGLSPDSQLLAPDPAADHRGRDFCGHRLELVRQPDRNRFDLD